MDEKRLIRSAGLVSALTSISRVLGFVRDVLLAGALGTSAAMSAFVIAYRLPNLFRALFGEGALSAAFIPVFVESRQRGGDAEAWRLARSVFTLLAVVLSTLVGLGMLISTIALSRPALDEAHRLTWSLFRIMVPYLLFICMAAVSMGALNAFDRFAVPAATPWVLNLVEIATLLWICPRLGPRPEQQVYGVAWSVVVAGVLQWGIQVPQLLQLGADLRPGLDRRDPRLLRVLALMAPAAIGRAVSQFNVFFATMLAAAIGRWAAAALYFSERLIYLPQGVFATALGTVLLPHFSRHGARHDLDGLRRAVSDAIRLILFGMLPAATGLFVLAEPIVRMSFEWRQFDAHSTLLTVRCLRVYCFGLVFFGLGKVVVPAFYGMQDTRTPVRVGVFAVMMNLLMSLTFRATWPAEWRHAGLAFSVVASEALNVLVLAAILERRIGAADWLAIGRSVARIIAACAVLAGAAVAANAAVSGQLARAAAPAKLAQVGGVLAALAAGAGAYVGMARALRMPEWRDMIAAFRSRRATPIAEI
ncbi:MAG: murein biosynthesis integral membrane protein MurJ [Kiritimatiellae bacterium]|nr:murein biosynthesis integral membrane protein MurJ [Kiritimatiellia bacterium]